MRSSEAGGTAAGGRAGQETSRRPGRVARAARGVLGAVVVGALILLLLEGSLRLASLARSAPFPTTDYKTRPWHTFDDPHVEVWHVPNTTTVQTKECLQATYSSNRFGMRDRERDLVGAKPRVAVLGDSVVEGFGVSDQQTFTRVLEDSVYDGDVEFLNFGTSGEFGTIQEWLLYRHLARRFGARVVLLVFLHVNDVTDNSWYFWQQLDPGRNRPYLRADGRGGFELFYPHGQGSASPGPRQSRAWRNALMRYSFLWRYWIEVQARYTRPPFSWQELYRSRPQPAWEDAWRFTEEAIRRLAEEVRHDGAMLLVLDCPGPAQISPGLALSIATRPGFDLAAPNLRLQEITRRLGVTYAPLLPAFLRYRDTHHLGPPYFSFSCDPHLSPLGNQVMANAVAEALRETALLPPPRRNALEDDAS